MNQGHFQLTQDPIAHPIARLSLLLPDRDPSPFSPTLRLLQNQLNRMQQRRKTCNHLVGLGKRRQQVRPPVQSSQERRGVRSCSSRKLVVSQQISARTVLPCSAASTTLLSIACIPVLARYRVAVGTSWGVYGTPGTSHANRQNLCWVAHAGGTTGCTPLIPKALVAHTRLVRLQCSHFVLWRYRVAVGTSWGGRTPGTSHANRQNLCWVAHCRRHNRLHPTHSKGTGGTHTSHSMHTTSMLL